MNEIANIVLQSDIVVVTKINRKSKANMFENLKVGNRVRFSIPIKEAGTRGCGTYASYIKVVNVDTNEETFSSFNQLPKILEAFEFERFEGAHYINQDQQDTEQTINMLKSMD